MSGADARLRVMGRGALQTGPMVVPEGLALAVLVPSPSCGLAGVGAEYRVTLGDLEIFMDQAAEPIPTQNPDFVLGAGGCGLSAGGACCRAAAQVPSHRWNAETPGNRVGLPAF